ncbi:MAG: hypothetical protein LBU07_06255 [Coriobacteriales bacterium]|jgi:X-X-X-Leu-X-X-Gly heptad repeat protein|nr:hypothetical protein [Coriobacteriales bacterium]
MSMMRTHKPGTQGNNTRPGNARLLPPQNGTGCSARTIRLAKTFHQKPQVTIRVGMALLLGVTLLMSASCTSQEDALPANDAILPAADADVDLSEAAIVQDKREVIYTNLYASGAPEAVYVVNHFRLEKGGFFDDFGDYARVENLSNTRPLVNAEGKVQARSPEGDFYYQGNMTRAALPWQFALNYNLDGNEVAATDVAGLAGQSGRLALRLATSKNPGTDSSFFEHYTLQVSLTVETARLSNIDAPDSTIAAAGSDTQITYAILPDSSGEISFAADFLEIAMPGISIAAVPFGMSFETPDTSGIAQDVSQLSSAIADLSKGIQELNTGTAELDKALASIATSSGNIQDGLSALSANSNGLYQGQTQLNTSLAQTMQGFEALQAQGAFAGLPPELQTQLATLIGGLSQINNGYAALAPGLKSYLDGVDGLASQYGQFDSGLGQTSDGLHQLSSATTQLTNGVGELYEGTRDMPESMQTQIDEFAQSYDFSGFEPHSFVSEQNQNVSLVQFVFNTPAIELPDAEEDEPTGSNEQTFWQRLLALFGL